jgi:hypothetical protein
MFRKYNSDIHTVFKKKGNNTARSMFNKSVPPEDKTFKEKKEEEKRKNDIERSMM